VFFLTFIRKLYKVLSSAASPSAVAFAVAFGVVAGCVPLMSGLALFLVLLVLVLRVNAAAALFAWVLTRLLVVGTLVGTFESVGETLLENEALKGFWTWLLNLPVVAWFGLEHYVIVGGAVVGVLLGAALFFPIRLLVILYRRYAHEKVSESKFFRWLTKFWVVRILRFVFVG